MMNRRGLLSGLLLAPAVVHSGSLMPVSRGMIDWVEWNALPNYILPFPNEVWTKEELDRWVAWNHQHSCPGTNRFKYPRPTQDFEGNFGAGRLPVLERTVTVIDGGRGLILRVIEYHKGNRT